MKRKEAENEGEEREDEGSKNERRENGRKGGF
jgi:hypothetical protein